MKIGNYQIGRYHAIIKNIYEDGSIDYETSFSSYSDFIQSVFAIENCIGKFVGTATDNPKVLVGIEIIRGLENINQVLL